MENITKELQSFLGYKDYEDDEGISQEVIDNSITFLRHILPLIPSYIEFNKDYVYPTSDTIIFDVQDDKKKLISFEIGKRSVGFFTSGFDKRYIEHYYITELEKVNWIFKKL